MHSIVLKWSPSRANWRRPWVNCSRGSVGIVFARLAVYPWQRERYWLSPQAAGPGLGPKPGWSRPVGVATHPLLGRRVSLASPSGTHVWELDFDKRYLPYLDDHRIQ